jgi:hypothetical protein
MPIELLIVFGILVFIIGVGIFLVKTSEQFEKEFNKDK